MSSLLGGDQGFPDVDIVLQGNGVSIDLSGKTSVGKSGALVVTFNGVPDAPVTSFYLNLPQGPFSALGTNKSLCHLTKTVLVRRRVIVKKRGKRRMVVRKVKRLERESLAMPTEVTGQNGVRYTQKTSVAVQGCQKTHGAKKRKR